MNEKENEFVPLNFEQLSRNPVVWEVIKEELQNLEGECLMKIITAAKEEGLKDNQIFFKAVEKTEIEFTDPFATSINDSTKED